MVKQMSLVVDCMSKTCAYNVDNKCHAIAINVGGPDSICDTFMEELEKCAGSDVSGGVGACKVKTCQFNDCLLCSAGSIRINNTAKCATYKSR